MSVIKPHLLAMSAYAPPLEGRNSDMYTLLDFNERTIPVGQSITDALQGYIASGRLHQYPAYGDIVSRLANYAGVDECQLMITNGSDQGIDLVFRAVSSANAEAIIPAPSFAMYTQCAQVEAMTIVQPLYTKRGGYPLKDVLSSITAQTAIIVVSNPNNPCGTITKVDDVARIAAAAPHAAILVDECYFEYTNETVVSLLDRFPNLFITRTFSKTWGIPSLRFGYLIAVPESIHALCNIRGPYDINQLAIVAATAALDNPDDTQGYVTEVMQKAKPLLEHWLNSQDIDYWPSRANYLWIFPKSAEWLNTYLTENGFLVRLKKYGDSVGLRVTVGTVAQMRRMMTCWEQVLAV